jgi:profilin
MSWQAYVDDQLIATGQVNKACIIGLNGGMWAQSAGFAVSLFFLLILASIPC